MIHANKTPEKPRCQAPTAPPPCRVRLAATSPTKTTSAEVLHNSAAEPCLFSTFPPNEYAVDRLNTKCLCGNQIYGAFVLNRSVDHHAIDALSLIHISEPTRPY